MKRSEMISAIEKELRTWEGSQLNKKTARKILNKIQELGMIPPAYEKVSIDKSSDKLNQFLYETKNEWEPE